MKKSLSFDIRRALFLSLSFAASMLSCEDPPPQPPVEDTCLRAKLVFISCVDNFYYQVDSTQLNIPNTVEFLTGPKGSKQWVRYKNLIHTYTPLDSTLHKNITFMLGDSVQRKPESEFCRVNFDVRVTGGFVQSYEMDTCSQTLAP